MKELLSDTKLQKSFDGKKLDVDDFINKLGVTKEDIDYWIKLKKPLKKDQKLFVAAGKKPEDLEKFIQKEILKK